MPSTLEAAVTPTSFAPVDEPVEVRQVEVEVGTERDVAQLDAELVVQHQPRHEVGVVLDLAQHDGVTGPQVLAPPGEGDEVDRLGRVLREDDLAVTGAARR